MPAAPTERGAVEVVNEWPDLDTAVRALASAGPSIPAIATVGDDAFCGAMRQAIAPFHLRRRWHQDLV